MAVKYLNNRDMLKQIHLSKSTYGEFLDLLDRDYDIILPSVAKINMRSTAEGKKLRVKRLERATGEKLDVKKIQKQDVIFRVMTFDHVPNSNRKANPKNIAESKVRCNFPPYQHWRYNEDGELICVGKSHWKGGLQNGHFSIDHGKMTNELAKMFMLLTQRYGTRGNWRGYTYNDEMQGQALMQLSQIGLQFDESKSENPFAYYTAAITNSFTRILNVEKKNQSLRDDILQENGMTPSHTRQIEWEIKQKAERDLKDKDSKV
jgi:hypothetical protein|tara:strand:- start:69 stop:854 length:786 start_codon:yes stop_codon:yes gene_type:complete